MSIGSVLKSIFASPAAKAIETIVITDTQRAVAALKATAIGSTVAADIASLINARLSGAEKFEQVVTNTLPLIAKLASSGGVGVVLADVEDVGRALVQQVYNDTLSTKAASIASLILRVLAK